MPTLAILATRVSAFAPATMSDSVACLTTMTSGVACLTAMADSVACLTAMTATVGPA